MAQEKSAQAKALEQMMSDEYNASLSEEEIAEWDSKFSEAQNARGLFNNPEKATEKVERERNEAIGQYYMNKANMALNGTDDVATNGVQEGSIYERCSYYGTKSSEAQLSMELMQSSAGGNVSLDDLKTKLNETSDDYLKGQYQSQLDELQGKYDSLSADYKSSNSQYEIYDAKRSMEEARVNFGRNFANGKDTNESAEAFDTAYKDYMTKYINNYDNNAKDADQESFNAEWQKFSDWCKSTDTDLESFCNDNKIDTSKLPNDLLKIDEAQSTSNVTADKEVETASTTSSATVKESSVTSLNTENQGLMSAEEFTKANPGAPGSAYQDYVKANRSQENENETTTSTATVKEQDATSSDKPDPYAGFEKPKQNEGESADDYNKRCNESEAVYRKEQNMKAAEEIWTKGSYGNGADRIKNLEAAGYDASEVQACVNEMIDGFEKQGLLDNEAVKTETKSYSAPQATVKESAVQAETASVPVNETKTVETTVEKESRTEAKPIETKPIETKPIEVTDEKENESKTKTKETTDKKESSEKSETKDAESESKKEAKKNKRRQIDAQETETTVERVPSNKNKDKSNEVQSTDEKSEKSDEKKDWRISEAGAYIDDSKSGMGKDGYLGGDSSKGSGFNPYLPTDSGKSYGYSGWDKDQVYQDDLGGLDTKAEAAAKEETKATEVSESSAESKDSEKSDVQSKIDRFDKTIKEGTAASASSKQKQDEAQAGE